MKKIIPMVLMLLLTLGCDELKHIAQQADTGRPLTQQEVVSGLRQALVIGSETAASGLSAADGYYRDAMVRIALPPEAQNIINNLSLLPGGEQLVEDLVLRINRAAEDAAKEAAPIFANAISGMSIQDGFNILRGDQNAATLYLREQTYDALFRLYQPKIKASVDKPLVGNMSTSETWNTLTGRWNNLAGSVAGRIANLQPVDTDLESYLTTQALDGLFIKLAIEEEKIRIDPAARITDLLKRVFG